VPSSIFRRPCCTPSPPTSLVMVKLSVRREILSISSIKTIPCWAFSTLKSQFCAKHEKEREKKCWNFFRGENGGLRYLEKAKNDRFHILSNIAGLGERRGVIHGKRNVENPCQCLGEKSFPRASRPHNHDIALVELHMLL